MVVRHHRFILAVGVVLFGLSVWSGSRIRIVTHTKDMLPARGPAVKSFNAISDAFGTTGNVLVTLEGVDLLSFLRGLKDRFEESYLEGDGGGELDCRREEMEAARSLA